MVHKSEYIIYSRFLIRKIHKAGCYGAGSIYQENLIDGSPDKGVAKKVLEALVKQRISLKKRKKYGWKYYLNKHRLDKIKEIIVEKGKKSVVTVLLML